MLLKRIYTIRFFIACCSFFIFTTLNAQTENYQVLIAKASLLHLQKNYKKAIDLYEKAFQLQQPDALTAYKAAGVFSLDSNSSKAFQYLQIALATGWTEADWLLLDPYFDYVRKADAIKWKTVEEEALRKEAEYAQTLQQPALRKEINLMTLNDQKIRYQKIQAKNDSARKAINRQIMKSDLQNMNRAKELIKQYGWPAKSQIGKDGQNNLWLIVQHADQDILFQKAALKAMEKLKGTNELNMENYAFLYDRIQCNLNYKQKYGTQVLWTGNGEASSFRPLENEYMANKIRAEIGLQPLQVYALTYGFAYDTLSAKTSKEKDKKYRDEVRLLIDSANFYLTKKQFQKTYDLYNEASTFLGGMSNKDNFEAAIVFSKIAAEDSDDKYKSIALDFLDLLLLRDNLTSTKLNRQSAFNILHNHKRWIAIMQQLN